MIEVQHKTARAFKVFWVFFFKYNKNSLTVVKYLKYSGGLYQLQLECCTVKAHLTNLTCLSNPAELDGNSPLMQSQLDLGPDVEREERFNCHLVSDFIVMLPI